MVIIDKRWQDKVTVSNILIKWSVMVNMYKIFLYTCGHIKCTYIFDTIKMNVKGNTARKCQIVKINISK